MAQSEVRLAEAEAGEAGQRGNNCNALVVVAAQIEIRIESQVLLRYEGSLRQVLASF